MSHVDVNREHLPLLRGEMGLSRADFARLVGLSERSIATLERGEDLAEPSMRKLVEIDQLHAKLSRSFTVPGSLSAWLTKTNKAFDGLKPLEVIERGQIHLIWRMIYRMESGTTS